MTGMDRNTGKPLDGLAHLIQSIVDILTTPIGSRVMRREYGSLLPQLADQPANQATSLALFAATADALRRWEPRIKLKKVAFAAIEGRPGAFDLTLDGERTDVPPANALVQLTFPLRLTPQLAVPGPPQSPALPGAL